MPITIANGMGLGIDLPASEPNRMYARCSIAAPLTVKTL